MGSFDVDIASLSTIEDVEQFEPQEDLVDISDMRYQSSECQPCEQSRSVVEADMLDIPHNPSSVDVNEIIDLQPIDPEEVVHGVNAPIQPPLAAENRENSISESSSLSLPDDIPYTMNFLSMIDLGENITPGVLGEISSDEDTDTS